MSETLSLDSYLRVRLEQASKLERQNMALLAALRAVEFQSVGFGNVCPWCHQYPKHIIDGVVSGGHLPNCQRQTALSLCV